MRIAVFGTGAAGQALGAAFADRGHEVVLGTRDPAATRARDGWDRALPLAEYDDAAAGADLVVNAVNGQAALEALASAAGRLDGLVLLDVANPLDFSAGFPPTLTVKDTDSLAEQIQRAHPGARVVKALNTVANEVMVDPAAIGDGDTTIFLAGDDPAARETVTELLEGLGWRDVIAFPELSAARGLEMWLPLWVRLMQQLGTTAFNLKIVR